VPGLLFSQGKGHEKHFFNILHTRTLPENTFSALPNSEIFQKTLFQDISPPNIHEIRFYDKGKKGARRNLYTSRRKKVPGEIYIQAERVIEMSTDEILAAYQELKQEDIDIVSQLEDELKKDIVVSP